MQFYSKKPRTFGEWKGDEFLLLTYLRKLKCLKWDKEERSKTVCDAEP